MISLFYNRYKKLSETEKVNIFGELFADDPKHFEFLPGEQDSIKLASAQAAFLLDFYKEDHCYEKEKPGSKRKRCTKNCPQRNCKRARESADSQPPSVNRNSALITAHSGDSGVDSMGQSTSSSGSSQQYENPPNNTPQIERGTPF